MPLYFMRHAQTDYNKKNLWMGLLDLHLNHEGVLQASSAASSMSELKISKIYSSPLKRAYQTASYIQKLQTTPSSIEELEGLKERDFGPFEGVKKTAEIRRRLEESNNVESKWLVRDRVRDALEKIEFEASLTKNDGNILIVSHSNVFRVIKESLNYTVSPSKNSIENAGLVKITKPSH